MRTGLIALLVASCLILSGCAKKPVDGADLGRQTIPEAISKTEKPSKSAALSDILAPPAGADHVVTASIAPRGKGNKVKLRTIRVGSQADLRLNPKEVILTFDDGPSLTQTPRILKTLAEYGARATFFMVGSRAVRNAEMAQKVVLAGHTVGSHTHEHENLARREHAVAMQAVAAGEDDLNVALASIGEKPAPFFRFPYLAQTRGLRADINGSGLVIFDVDVDSADFLKESSQTVLARTKKRLKAQGGGIVLFHDIHARTAKMLPEFLQYLVDNDYTVVHAIPRHGQTTLFAEWGLRLSALEN